ncbi:NAD-dependent dehydratase [Fictibacillus phosphorivorans]|uniref:NAD-dependent dehydratase n=1 Tax=Fictibacillus phosphorivorans TaxID=1221500 RepID=A0A165MUF8_9BACL|nr:UDP-glucuronic acid decarboxylase family protein [Fictibacillus phosphorivorans]KZE63418.1 NAD-dependent dehydratase [Fictibacillus phosphorivorans]
MKKIVITGVAGFLGSHLAKDLLSKKNKVIGLDNFSTGKKQNLSSFSSNTNFTLIEIDVSKEKVMDLEELNGIDEIYHLASPASPAFYQKTPFDTIAVNTIGTKNMLDIAKRNNAKLVYLSTSEVYGDPEIHPQHEDYKGSVNTWGPRACYDEGKRLGEVFCYLYYQLFNLQVKVARIFNTYSAGLRNDDGRVISNFITQALKGENITVYGDGTQTRSFCYVDDTIEALTLMMKNDKANGEIINIGNSEEISVINLATLIQKLTNSSSLITFHPLPKDDPKQRCPNTNKAKQILGWEPKINLQEGLLRTIKEYRIKLGYVG